MYSEEIFMDRRRFLLECGRVAPSFLLIPGALSCKMKQKKIDPFLEPARTENSGERLFGDARPHGELARHPSSFFQKLDAGRVKCTVCPWDCELSDGERGTCGVRINEGGSVFSLSHGLVCDLRVTDLSGFVTLCLIEKPVLFVGLFGCSFDCEFCLSLTGPIDFPRPEDYSTLLMGPEQVVDKAQELGCEWLDLGYFEPTVSYEFALDICRLAHERGLKVMMDTNGFVHPRPMKELLQYVDCVWLGLKGFSAEVYRDLCLGRLDPVLDTIKLIDDSSTYLGINLLLFPLEIEPMSSIERGLGWLAENVELDTIINLNGFVPSRRMRNMPLTPEKYVDDVIREAGKAGFEETAM